MEAKLNIVYEKIKEAPLMDEIKESYDIHDKLNLIFSFIRDIKQQQDRILKVLVGEGDIKEHASQSAAIENDDPVDAEALIESIIGADDEQEPQQEPQQEPEVLTEETLCAKLNESFDGIMKHRNEKARAVGISEV